MKFIDDASQIASVNLKKSLVPDRFPRPRPLNYHKRTEMVISPQENVLQGELDKFCQFTESSQLVINKGKCYVMQFSKSKKFDFPPEFTIGVPKSWRLRKSTGSWKSLSKST